MERKGYVMCVCVSENVTSHDVGPTLRSLVGGGRARRDDLVGERLAWSILVATLRWIKTGEVLEFGEIDIYIGLFW